MIFKKSKKKEKERRLMSDYKNGIVLQVDNNVDNVEYIREKREEARSKSVKENIIKSVYKNKKNGKISKQI